MGKNPFVGESEFETYGYPHPLDPDDEDQAQKIDPEVTDEKDKPWVRFRIPRSRRDQDLVADFGQLIITATGGVEQRIARANRTTFEYLVDSWSFTERKPNGDDYDKLVGWAGDWVLAALADAVGQGMDREWVKKVPPSSKKPSGSRKTSASDSDPSS